MDIPWRAASVGRLVGWSVGRSTVRDHGGLSFLRRDGGTIRENGENFLLRGSFFIFL